MTFKVPQFIEVEDKIFGPLTLKQFVYLAGGVGSVVVFRAFFSLPIAIVLAAPFVALGAALAFYRMNDQPFIRIVESAFYFYVIKNRLYLWKKVENKAATKNAVETTQPIAVPKVEGDKLKNLAWSLDIKETMQGGTSKTTYGN